MGESFWLTYQQRSRQVCSSSSGAPIFVAHRRSSTNQRLSNRRSILGIRDLSHLDNWQEIAEGLPYLSVSCKFSKRSLFSSGLLGEWFLMLVI